MGTWYRFLVRVLESNQDPVAAVRKLVALSKALRRAISELLDFRHGVRILAIRKTKLLELYEEQLSDSDEAEFEEIVPGLFYVADLFGGKNTYSCIIREVLKRLREWWPEVKSWFDLRGYFKILRIEDVKIIPDLVIELRLDEDDIWFHIGTVKLETVKLLELVDSAKPVAPDVDPLAVNDMTANVVLVRENTYENTTSDLKLLVRIV